MSDTLVQSSVIKAITLWQPWAQLVARGVKRHDTRYWPTEYRGPIAIHAARTVSLVGAPEDLCLSALGLFWQDRAPKGCIVAIAELRSCRPALDLADRITRADGEAGNFTQGLFAWEFAKVRPLKLPIPCTGRQGLFNWTLPDNIGAQLGPERDHREICHQIGWS